MNLIEDKWIPARRQSGKIEMIAPWGITDAFDRDPFTQIAAPRPDFNGALIQFLIGLLQTCFAPINTPEWRQRLLTPPSRSDLSVAFLTLAPWFVLDGEGPRFMQDLTLSQEVAGLEEKAREDRVKPIGDLLIEWVFCKASG